MGSPRSCFAVRIARTLALALALGLLPGPSSLALSAQTTGTDPEEPTPGPARAPRQSSRPVPTVTESPSALPAGSRTSRLQGSAYLDRRTGVVGASVLARPETGGPQIYLTTTDQKGRFRIDGLPDGDYRLELRREGLRPVTKSNVSMKFPFRSVVEVAMQPGEAGGPAEESGADAAPDPGGTTAERAALLRGRIVTQDGKPVPEVRLRLVRGDGTRDPREVRSGKAGEFDLAEVLPGGWLLSVRGLGYLPIDARLDLRDETDLTLVLVPQPNGYEPSPLELLPPEQPSAPALFAPGPLPEPPAPSDGPAAVEEVAGESDPAPARGTDPPAEPDGGQQDDPTDSGPDPGGGDSTKGRLPA